MTSCLRISGPQAKAGRSRPRDACTQPRRVKPVGSLGLADTGFRLATAGATILSLVWSSLAQAAPPETSDAKFVPDPASVTRYVKGWRYPRAGWHVVHIEGAPYDRGYQHGKLLASEIAEYIETLAGIRSPKSPHEAWRDMRLLVSALFLRRYDAEYLEEMKGIADGAAAEGAKYDDRRIDLVDIVCINSEIEVSYLDNSLDASATGLEKIHFHGPQYSQPKARPHEHCSAFAATGSATSDGRIVLGHITMSELATVPHYNVWLDIQPATGHRVVMQTFPGGIQSGLDYYVNSAGLVVAETTIGQTKFNPQGIPLASRIRRAVQYADSIDRVIEILSDSSNGLYTNQWLLADIKTSEIAMFELGTDRTRAWRSSRNEWFDGAKDFYWGCNNNRDLDVLKETVPDLAGKPANLVRYPHRRDRTWLALFNRHVGKIGEAFAFEAFETPPLAAFPSCDAKFTTSKLAQNLASWALFGPPLGRTWEASPDDKKKYPGVRPLVANDWVMLEVDSPGAARASTVSADLEHFPDKDEDEELPVKFDALHPFAWRGTLLPKSSRDLWLAASFSEYEKVVALEHALKREIKETSGHRNEKSAASGHLKIEARDLVDLALFAHESKWRAAARRLGRDLQLVAIEPSPGHSEWYDIALGKGVMLLAALRASLGDDLFERLMDEFGQAHAGREATADEFAAHFRKGAGKPAAEILAAWLESDVPVSAASTGDIWTIYSFEAEPEQALIVRGTLGDVAAQREAADLLQRTLARRFSNFLIPIKADTDVADAELRNRHLIMVGRPATNRVAATCAAALPVSFGRASFTVREETYAHPGSAVIVAGDNPHNPRYSAVTYAGLGAEATWKCVQHLEPDELPSPQVILFPAGRKTARFRVSVKPPKLAQP